MEIQLPKLNWACQSGLLGLSHGLMALTVLLCLTTQAIGASAAASGLARLGPEECQEESKGEVEARESSDKCPRSRLASTSDVGFHHAGPSQDDHFFCAPRLAISRFATHQIGAGIDNRC